MTFMNLTEMEGVWGPLSEKCWQIICRIVLFWSNFDPKKFLIEPKVFFMKFGTEVRETNYIVIIKEIDINREWDVELEYMVAYLLH